MGIVDGIICQWFHSILLNSPLMDLQQQLTVMKTFNIIVVHQIHVTKVLVGISNEQLVPFLDCKLNSLLFSFLIGVHAQVEDLLFSHLAFFFFVDAEIIQGSILLHHVDELFLLGLGARCFNL